MTGSELVAIANKHIGESYILGVIAPKDRRDYKGPWDCAEFASWLVYQATGDLYGCFDDDNGPFANADAFTGYWARDAKAKGKIITIDQAAATPGTFLLRLPKAASFGHIVMCSGNGGTVEAHSSKTGVIASVAKQRRWDYGIAVPGIDYFTETTRKRVEPPATAIYRLVSPAMNGMQVKEIQEALEKSGFSLPLFGADGWYGKETADAVVAFQKFNGLVMDGEVGEQTAKELDIKL